MPLLRAGRDCTAAVFTDMHATGDTHSVELGQQLAHDPGAENITGNCMAPLPVPLKAKGTRASSHCQASSACRWVLCFWHLALFPLSPFSGRV